MLAMTATGSRADAQAALDRGDWKGAADGFRLASAAEETAEALEGLGTALWWLDDQANVLDARERAYRLYRSAGDARGAARVATSLALDYADYRQDLAVCNGWLQRAERLLSDLETSSEHGWYELFHGFVSLMFESDVEAAWRHQRAAAALDPLLGVIDIQMMTIALEGLIKIREGKVAEGMRHLDEAMTAATGGEMSDLAAIGMTCCSLIYACEAVADYDRAQQWCDRAREFCRRLGMDLFFAICRNYYATVLIWKGAWAEAEEELSAVMKAMEPMRPDYLRESLAKLGELRRRQGRAEEAESLFVRAEPHRLALIGRAALAVDRGDPESAIDLLQRSLRRSGEEDQAERVFSLELLIRAQLQHGEVDAGSASLSELETAARAVGTQPLLATAAAARGAVLLATGDADRARSSFEDAIDLFEATDADFDAARMRLLLGEVLLRQARQPAALEQTMIAQTTFKRLGAMYYTEKAGALLAQLSGGLGEPPPPAQLPHGLTPREAEVLWLIAAGKTNQDIADELVLSIRTVERHISTVYEKLQLTGRAARASAAAIAAGLRANA
jgi:ATP/maltotriose-dependent transcriptional regulator MalT